MRPHSEEKINMHFIVWFQYKFVFRPVSNPAYIHMNHTYVSHQLHNQGKSEVQGYVKM